MTWESCWYASPADLASMPSSASSSFALTLGLNMLQSPRASSIPLIPEFHFFCARFTPRATSLAPLHHGLPPLLALQVSMFCEDVLHLSLKAPLMMSS